jgi:L-fuconolactonase
VSYASQCAALVPTMARRPEEEALEPDLPIIDPHHHLWAVSMSYRAGRRITDEDLTGFERQSLLAPRYLIEDLLRDTGTGHNVVATVFAQAHAMYRADASQAMAPVGETEFVNGVAAMAASGDFGPTRVAEGIVGFADLRLGDAVQDVLEAHLRAGGERFKGIRQNAAWSPDPSVLGPLSHTPPRLLLDEQFRKGFARVADLGLTFDTWLLAPQLTELVDLARAFPEAQIVLDHVGTPAYIGRR